jgi:hypothetical protein
VELRLLTLGLAYDLLYGIVYFMVLSSTYFLVVWVFNYLNFRNMVIYMTKDEAIHKALKVLNCLNNDRVYETAWVKGAINACEEALEQPAQEPVALLEVLSDLEHQQWIKWAKSIIDSEPISEARKQRWLTMMVDYKDLPDNIQEYDREWARKVMALYTHPHQWQGLTDKEDNAIIKKIWIWGNDFPYEKYRIAIEQALKDKNT